jgi:hypothetical protein
MESSFLASNVNDFLEYDAEALSRMSGRCLKVNLNVFEGCQLQFDLPSRS